MAIITPPTGFLTNWTPGVTVGVPGGIDRFLPSGANARANSSIDVTGSPYFCDPLGVVDSTAGMNAALAALPINQVLVLPSGTFKVEALEITSNRTIRGQGRNNDGSYKTILKPTSTLAVFSIGTNNGSAWNTPATGNFITSGLYKDSTILEISSTTGFQSGQMARIAFQNQTNNDYLRSGAELTFHVYGLDYVRVQMTRVTEVIDSRRLRIFPGIINAPDSNLAAKINYVGDQFEFVGIEDLEIDGVNDASLSFGIVYEQNYGSWLKGVAIRRPRNYHVFFITCLQCEMRSCILDTRAGEGTNGAGLLFNNVASTLIENNQFLDMIPGIEYNQGTVGCVTSYNFANGIGVGMNINHGPHNSYNLYEGNISPWIQADGYFGGSSRDTLYKNWFTARTYGAAPALDTNPVSLNRFTRDYSLYGNLLASSDWSYAGQFNPYSFGNPNLSNSCYNDWSSFRTGSNLPLDWNMSATVVSQPSDSEMLVRINSGSIRYYGGQNNTPGQFVISYPTPGSTYSQTLFCAGINTLGGLGTEHTGFCTTTWGGSGDFAYTTLSKLWYIEGEKNTSGNLIGAWSTPRQLSSFGADPIQYTDQGQFSVNPTTGWHFGYQTGDSYFRRRANTSSAYSGVSFIGADISGGGNFTSYRFRWTPTANVYGTGNVVPPDNNPSVAGGVSLPSTDWSLLPSGTSFGAQPSGTFLSIYPADAGYQEQDTDVSGTSVLLGNVFMGSNATIPPDQAIPIGDTLKPSLYLTGAPSWWDTNLFTWPPFDPVNPVGSYSAIPAGYDFLINIPPSVTTANISSNGNQLVLTFNKPVYVNDGTGFTVSYTDVTVTYASGSGTTQLFYNISRTIIDIEEGYFGYTTVINGIVDINGVDLQSFSDFVIANYSQETGGAIWYDGALPANANGTHEYGGVGWTRIQKINIEQSGIIVATRIYIDSKFFDYTIKMAIYDFNTNELLTSGEDEITEVGNYTIVGVNSVHVPAGNYLLAFQIGSNSDPEIAIQTGVAANSSFYNVATSYANFPVDPLPTSEAGYNFSFVAGIDVIPDAQIQQFIASRMSESIKRIVLASRRR